MPVCVIQVPYMVGDERHGGGTRPQCIGILDQMKRPEICFPLGAL